ncbi:MAG: hypothetical protein A2Y59_03005 [Chloroflexi bacterium RBG_13_52_14]|nr:MAG: hypothetical protein A2Y59_03005 [Chloroflexi bacterium RBG_13_52_14]
MDGLPFEIKQAIIQTCGKIFWLKRPFRSFLLSAGVPVNLYTSYAQEPKYTIISHILDELETMGDDGFLIQRRILTELCKLRNIPDATVQDREAALSELQTLKELAHSQKIIVEEGKSIAYQREKEAASKRGAIEARKQKIERLAANFASMISCRDEPQKRGYELEDLLAELFEVNDIDFRRPYRTPTEQIDGSFEYKGFNYLLEARWRVNPPSEADLGAFKIKVDKKLESTRGIFISIVPFRPEVVSEFTRGVSSNIILFDGSDLALIFEGRISLVEALNLKVRKASQEGIIYFSLREHFSTG